MRFSKSFALATLLFGVCSHYPALAEEQSIIGEWADSLVSELCLSSKPVSDLLNAAQVEAWAQDKGILCKQVVDDDNSPAPEGLETYDATGGTEKRRVEKELVDSLLEKPTFDFESLLPAPKLDNDVEEIPEETQAPRHKITKSDSPLHKTVEVFDFDAEMASSKPAAAKEKAIGTPIGFGDIYDAREQIALDATKGELFSKSQQIAYQCQCIFNRVPCYKSTNYQFDEINAVARETESNLSTHRATVCNGWVNNLRGKTSDDQEVLGNYLQDSNRVLSNLATLNNSHSSLVADLGQKEIRIQNEIRRRNKQQQAALAKQNAGPSGWQIAGAIVGAAGIASSGLPTDQAAKVGSAFIEDMLSDGSGTSMAETLQNQGYRSGNSGLQASSYSTSSATKTPSHQLESPNAPSLAAGSYGVVIYGVNGNEGALIVSSKSSAEVAESEGFGQCGALCSGQVLHAYFGPGQCIALVTGSRPDRAHSSKYLKTATSKDAAIKTAGDACDQERRAANLGGAMSCTLAASACN